jgi:dsRNA-specific ribonuclease
VWYDRQLALIDHPELDRFLQQLMLQRLDQVLKKHQEQKQQQEQQQLQQQESSPRPETRQRQQQPGIRMRKGRQLGLWTCCVMF